MNNEMQSLGKQIAAHNLINPGVVVSAKMTIKGFGHAILATEKTGTVISIDGNGIKGVFEGKQRYSRFEDITAIEGMDLPRFAQAYRIKTVSKKKKN